MVDDKREQEVYRTLYTLCCKAYNDLAKEGKKRTKRKDAVMIASPIVVLMLESLDDFKLDDDIRIKESVHKVGTIGKFDVYRNMEAKDNSIGITAFCSQSTITVKGI